VYQALDGASGKSVAIKVLRAELMQYPGLVSRFFREARAAELVRHPNIVDVFSVGEDTDGTPYIVQELLDGEDLSSYVARCGGSLSIEHTLLLMMPIVEAVSYAHQKSVVHRDLKPENVFLAKSEAVVIPKLLDFGISRIHAAGEARLTTAGESIGTPAYMSPEQIRSSAEVDARTDVWALGVMMFELLSGRLPYPSPDPQTLFVEIATKAPPRLGEVVRGIPQPLAKVVDRCLRHARDERYPTAAELGKDLRRAIASTPELAARLPHLAQVDDAFVDRRDLADWTSQSDASASGRHSAVAPQPSTAAPDENASLEIEDSAVSRRSGSMPDDRGSSPNRASHPGRASPTGSGPYNVPAVAPITGAGRPRQQATMVVPNRAKKSEASKVSASSIALVVVVALLIAGLGVLIVFILEPDWLHH